MLILSIDTSAIASAALLSGDGYRHAVAANFETPDTRSHAEVLAAGIQGLLTDAEVQGPALDAIVVGVGPGPFTGLRSGIATARALAFAWQVPLHGLMSLDAIAAAAAVDAWRHGTDEFLVATDARRREVYWARYASTGGNFDLLDGPHVGPAAGLPALPVYGKGAGLYPDDVLAVEGFSQRQPTAEALGLTALLRLEKGLPLLESTPLYLRESDARVPGPRKRALHD